MNTTTHFPNLIERPIVCPPSDPTDKTLLGHVVEDATKLLYGQGLEWPAMSAEAIEATEKLIAVVQKMLQGRITDDLRFDYWDVAFEAERASCGQVIYGLV